MSKEKKVIEEMEKVAEIAFDSIPEVMKDLSNL